MFDQRTVCLLTIVGLVLCASLSAQEQRAPDMVIFNGKIVTVDNSDFTTDLGTIAQAMAMRDGRIVAIGSDSQVRSLAESVTKSIDLQGKTVLPGFILVHEHPYDWAGANFHALKKILSDDDIVFRTLEGSPSEQVEALPGVLKEAVGKAKPGQWIYIVFPFGNRYQYATGGNGGYGLPNIKALDGEQFTKELLDQIAPHNPVLLRDVFVGFMVNDRAMDEIDKMFPDKDVNRLSRETGQGGIDGGANFRSIFHDVVMENHYQKLKDIHRLELRLWAGYGMTTFASLAYTPSNIRVYRDLAKEGKLPVRNMWMWNWRDDVFFADQYVINFSVFMEGLGDDMFWYGGAQGSSENGRGCSMLPPRGQLTPVMLACAFAPGRPSAEMLYNYIKSGGRFVGNHTVGDKDIDYILDIITKASQDAGFTLEEVRAKRHTYDHLVMSPRPDQLPRIKNLGMILGGDGFEVWQAPPAVLKFYGEKALEWVVPRRSLVDAGIANGFEVDRAIASTDLTIFWVMARMLDRRAWDGNVYGASQRVEREVALKTITAWGSQYLIKEDRLGSLEPGKWADFIVLDRDFLTIPEEEIEDIQVLMTVRGGQVTHLVPALAEEIGMPTKSARLELGM